MEHYYDFYINKEPKSLIHQPILKKAIPLQHLRASHNEISLVFPSRDSSY